GLMQLMPGTAKRFRVSDPFDPVDNVFGAARYLDFLRRWETVRPGSNGSLAEILAAYNAGEGAVDTYSGIPPYSETQECVRRVMRASVIAGLVRRPALSADIRYATVVSHQSVKPVPPWASRLPVHPLFQPNVVPLRASANPKPSPQVDLFDQ